MTTTQRPGKHLCPNGCGQRIYSGNLKRHLTACRRTPTERRELQAERRWAAFVAGE